MSDTTKPGLTRLPRLNDSIHFVLYYAKDGTDDPNMIGQCRGGWVSFVHEDGSVDLNYQVGRQPNEPDNPPDFIEHKIRRFHAWPAKPSTWHYSEEH